MSTSTKRYCLKITLSGAVIAAVITLTCGCDLVDQFLWGFLVDALQQLGTLPVVP